MNKPFLFTENQSAISRLTKKLEDLKLSVHAVKSSESAYIPARMSINCPWMHEQKFEIVWNRTWRPDGMQMEDEYVTIDLDGLEVWRVNIREMFDRKLSQPLADEIVEQLVHGVNSAIHNKHTNSKT
ncbi:hypothetical protein D1AOALGA4SA_1010 [Olavius algarvensis Delta 1 endosymbiont]|nr:hypothetical protein D1AOALGA4SA_1010 [Olavius algarvensis Delta 1 endosymbiont]